MIPDAEIASLFWFRIMMMATSVKNLVAFTV
jgi:hypothetical protein